MKKTIIILTAILSILAMTSCTQEEPLTVKDFITDAAEVNAMIEELGEVNDVKSAALVAKIVEAYKLLPDTDKAKVVGLQKVTDQIETASTFLDEDLMKIKVMSYNIQDGERGISEQLGVLQMIINEAPDIIGVQESEDSGNITQRLKRKLTNYECLGTGRDWNKSGESVNVYYNTDKFRLAETDTMWATDTPDVYSKHPDSLAYKVFTYQLLERISDGQVFLHVNLHLDHSGNASTVYQAEIITSWIEEKFGGEYYPTVITGDFNVTPGARALQVFSDAGYRVTSTYGETFRTYHARGERADENLVLDYIYVNDLFPIVSYKVCPEKLNGDYPSDHNAIVSEILLLPGYDLIEIPEE